MIGGLQSKSRKIQRSIHLRTLHSPELLSDGGIWRVEDVRKVGETEGGEWGTVGQCNGRTPTGIIYGGMALEEHVPVDIDQSGRADVDQSDRP